MHRSADDLFGPAGGLLCRPGAARPDTLTDTRPDWTARLARGRLADPLPDAWAGLFSLCGDAHRLGSRLAIAAARGQPMAPSGAQRRAHARATVHEHLRRIWLDWPIALLAPDGPGSPGNAHAPARPDRAARVLSQYPGWRPDSAPAACADWIERELTGMPMTAWLDAWADDPAAWLTRWCEQPRTLAARCVLASRHACEPFMPALTDACMAVPALLPRLDRLSIAAWAAELSRDDLARARAARWQGGPAQTGLWTRLHRPSLRSGGPPWLALGARIADTIRLSLPTEQGSAGGDWLTIGAQGLGDGEGIAWIEMARGLLLHRVTLDRLDESARIADCRVIAPTDWNFDPDGVVARLIERLPPGNDETTLRGLRAVIAAYDPCVPVRISPAGAHRWADRDA